MPAAGAKAPTLACNVPQRAMGLSLFKKIFSAAAPGVAIIDIGLIQFLAITNNRKCK
jgi:hypothetical protein